MSKPRRNKKTKTPKPKFGRGIWHTSDLIDWSKRPARGTLKDFSSPSSPPLPPLPIDKPARFQSPSRLETLKSPLTESVSWLARSVHDRITTPFNTVDTTHNYTELNSSTSLPSTENQEKDREQEAVNSSASSGYSPGGSSHKSHKHNRSVDPDTSEPRYFDSALEHFVMHILKVKLTHEIAYALDQAFINTFDEFRTIDTVDVHTFTYKWPSDTNSTLLHMMLVKQIQSGIHYCRFLEDGNDPACDDPTMMDYDKYNKWRRNGYAVYQASSNPIGGINHMLQGFIPIVRHTSKNMWYHFSSFYSFTPHSIISMRIYFPMSLFLIAHSVRP
jgi:hypothetical protein